MKNKLAEFAHSDNMNLTEYQKSKFPHIDSMKMETWHKINVEREDYAEFIACLDKYNQVWKLLEIDLENNRFKKTYRPESREWAKENNIEL